MRQLTHGERLCRIRFNNFNAKYDIGARVNERKEIAKVCACLCERLCFAQLVKNQFLFELHFAQCDLWLIARATHS